MTIPEAAIEAAALVMAGRHPGDADMWTLLARAAIEAAMPAIREALAQEIEANPGKWPGDGHRPSVFQAYAARIVRGGTP